MDQSLGERELDVMGVLWGTGPGTAAEVRDRLRERLDADLAYNTVLTVLRNLETKEFVEHTAEGRTHRYHPTVSEHAVRDNALSRVVDKLFRGSPLQVIAHLVEHETLSAADLRALHQLLDQQSEDTSHSSPRSAGTVDKRATEAAPKRERNRDARRER